MIGKSKCLPFQRHVINCNRSLLSEDTALLMWLGHKSNLTVVLDPIIILGFHSLPLYRVKTKNDDRDSAQLQDLAIQILTFPIYGAVSRLSHKQLSQIRYHFKA